MLVFSDPMRVINAWREYGFSTHRVLCRDPRNLSVAYVGTFRWVPILTATSFITHARSYMNQLRYGHMATTFSTPSNKIASVRACALALYTVFYPFSGQSEKNRPIRNGFWGRLVPAFACPGAPALFGANSLSPNFGGTSRFHLLLHL